MTLRHFIESWTHPDSPPRPVSDEQLDAVETHFGFTFPTDYRSAVLRYGLVSPSIALLDTIVERELDLADLSELLEPDEMIASTETWREMGLPPTMVAFASDCCGNLFCFDAEGAGSAAGSVFLFDYDRGTTRRIAPSFERWIDTFCSLDPR